MPLPVSASYPPAGIPHQQAYPEGLPPAKAFSKGLPIHLYLSQDPSLGINPSLTLGDLEGEVTVLRLKTTENIGHETLLFLLSMARGGDQAICQGKSALTKGFWLGVWRDDPIISLVFQAI